jgi:hypothetical protein
VAAPPAGTIATWLTRGAAGGHPRAPRIGQRLATLLPSRAPSRARRYTTDKTFSINVAIARETDGSPKSHEVCAADAQKGLGITTGVKLRGLKERSD